MRSKLQVSSSGYLSVACVAVNRGIEALESLVMAYEAAGDPLPEPSTVCAIAR